MLAAAPEPRRPCRNMAAMPYLIDASNLGGVLGGRAGARDATAVVRFLQPWARGRGRVVAVCDGPARPDVADRYGTLEVRWSGRRTADEVLVALARKGPAAWTVVTADRGLARRCRELGARVEPATALIERVVRPHPADPRRAGPGDKPADGEELAHWRRVFGDPPPAEGGGAGKTRKSPT